MKRERLLNKTRVVTNFWGKISHLFIYPVIKKGSYLRLRQSFIYFYILKDSFCSLTYKVILLVLRPTSSAQWEGITSRFSITETLSTVLFTMNLWNDWSLYETNMRHFLSKPQEQYGLLAAICVCSFLFLFLSSLEPKLRVPPTYREGFELRAKACGVQKVWLEKANYFTDLMRKFDRKKKNLGVKIRACECIKMKINKVYFVRV